MQTQLLKKVFFLTAILSLASCAYTSKVTDGLFSGADSEYQGLVMKADAAVDDGDFTKAEALYEKAVIMKPDNLTLKLKLARAYQRDGKLAQAYNRYQTIIEQTTNNLLDSRVKETAKADQARLGFKPEVAEAQEAQQETKVEEPAPAPAAQITLAPEVTQPVETAPEPIQANPVVEVAPTKVEAQAPEADQKAVMLAVSSWSDAWSNKNLPLYFSSYVSGFAGQLPNEKAWRHFRKNKISNAQKIKIELSDMKFANAKDGSVEVSFIQNYQAANYKDSGRKVLTMKNINGRWLISQEISK